MSKVSDRGSMRTDENLSFKSCSGASSRKRSKLAFQPISSTFANYRSFGNGWLRSRPSERSAWSTCGESIFFRLWRSTPTARSLLSAIYRKTWTAFLSRRSIKKKYRWTPFWNLPTFLKSIQSSRSKPTTSNDSSLSSPSTAKRSRRQRSSVPSREQKNSG